MRCQQVRRAWLEPELPAKARRHMEQCQACRQAWAWERKLQAGLNAWTVANRDLPAEWHAQLRQRLAAARLSGWRLWLESWRWQWNPRPLRLASAALLLFLVAGAGLYLRPRLRPPQTRPGAGVVSDLQALNRNQDILQCPLFASPNQNAGGGTESGDVN